MGSKKEKTRAHILDVSYMLFAKHGFNKVTMKDVCDAANLSRGGLYSHFSSTRDLFEAILEQLSQKDEMNFYAEMDQGVSATQILNNAFTLMEKEMNHPEDSLSLAMYEYAGKAMAGRMDHFTKIGEEKWTALINYGIARGEFHNMCSSDIVSIILYAYQGVRMWSRITAASPETFASMLSFIKKLIIKEDNSNEIYN